MVDKDQCLPGCPEAREARIIRPGHAWGRGKRLGHPDDAGRIRRIGEDADTNSC